MAPASEGDEDVELPEIVVPLDDDSGDQEEEKRSTDASVPSSPSGTSGTRRH